MLRKEFEKYWPKSAAIQLGSTQTHKHAAYLAWRAGANYARRAMRYDALTAHMEGIINDKFKDAIDDLANEAICDVLEAMKEEIDAELTRLSS